MPGSNQNRTATHFSEEFIEAYAMGRAAESEAARFEEHLLICDACQVALSGVDDFLTAFRVAAVQYAQEENAPTKTKKNPFLEYFGTWSFASPLGLAAACAAICLAIWIPRQGSQAPIGAEANLTAMRGAGEVTAHVPSGKGLALNLDALDLAASVTHRIDLVNSAGHLVWQGHAAPQNGRIRVEVKKKLGTGLFWVRVYEDNRQVREFGLRVD